MCSSDLPTFDFKPVICNICNPPIFAPKIFLSMHPPLIPVLPTFLLSFVPPFPTFLPSFLPPFPTFVPPYLPSSLPYLCSSLLSFLPFLLLFFSTLLFWITLLFFYINTELLPLYNVPFLSIPCHVTLFSVFFYKIHMRPTC